MWKTIDELEKKLDHIQGEERIEILVDLSTKYLSKQPHKSIEYCQQSQYLLKENPNNELELNNLNIECKANISIGDNKKARLLACTLLKLSKSIDNKKYYAESLRRFGSINRNMGNYEASLANFTYALKIYEPLDDKTNCAVISNCIGTVYWKLTKYSDALEYYFKALKLLDEIENKILLASIYNNIAIIFKILKEYDKSLEYFFKSLKIDEDSNYNKGVAVSLNNIGSLFYKTSKYSKALKYLNKALKIGEEIDYKLLIADSNATIGSVYQNKGNFDISLRYYLKSLKIEKEINNKSGISSVMCNIGYCYFKLSQYSKAIEYMKKSLSLAQSIHSSEIILEAYVHLSEVYKSKEIYKKALLYKKLYSRKKNQIFNDDSSKKIAQIHAMLEAESNKKETEIYRLKNILLVKANNKLESVLHELKTLTGLLPICPSCKKIKNDKEYWVQVEEYIGKHSEIQFTHGLCPDCIKIYFPPIEKKKFRQV